MQNERPPKSLFLAALILSVATYPQSARSQEANSAQDPSRPASETKPASNEPAKEADLKQAFSDEGKLAA